MLSEKTGPGLVVMITGAASGIGRHWAGVLQARGEYCLLLGDVDEQGLRASFAESDCLALFPLDVRRPDHWQAAIEEARRRFGRIDYLFNIAGGGRPAFLLDQSLENLEWILDVNLKGALLGMRLVGEVMVRQGWGHIVNVASLAGLSPIPGNSIYSAAKGGLRNASLAAAIEWRRHGVAVTVILPDVVDTPIMERHLKYGGEEVALTYTGVVLTVHDLERAFWQAMRKRPLEIVLPRWRGWLPKLNHAFPSLMFWLYEPLKRRGLKRLEQIRRERGIFPE